MRANEFVKKFEWEYAKERMEYCKGARLVGMEIDLKRLVESHELVGRFGGLEMAKGVAAIDDNESYLGERFGPCDELKQAIADVESCQ